LKGIFKVALAQLSGFLFASFAVVYYRTVLISMPCDPKFECLCSFSCLLSPIAICALIQMLSLSIIYFFQGRGRFKVFNKHQFICLFIAGCFLGLFAFANALITIVVIYGGYLTIWLSICMVVSFLSVRLANKYNKIG